MTKEEEESLRKLTIEFRGKKVGSWLIDAPYAGGYIALIYEDSGTVKLAQVVPNGERFDEDMSELKSQRGRRFKKIAGGDLYDVDEAGVLRIIGRDNKVVEVGIPLK